VSTDDPKLTEPAKEWIYHCVGFYQQLLGNGSATYEKAIRTQYRTENKYKTAVKPLRDAEQNVLKTAAELIPMSKHFVKVFARALDQEREVETKRLFSKKT